mmetsp:Transcript_46846/g.142221  ORF Transcript_46846/g.142221 Transcript_46846/m.142221 type:complete len:153 (-) Transcript_46846:38-496(-)
MAPAIPKVAIAPERWTETLYGAPEGGLIKAEAGKLGAMKFDPSHWSRAYLQCIGRGVPHKECAAGIPDDVRTTPAGPLAGHRELSSAIACMGEHGDPDKCAAHFDALAALAGFKEETKQTTTEKVSDFCGKAGYKLLGAPMLLLAMKFVKVK